MNANAPTFTAMKRGHQEAIAFSNEGFPGGAVQMGFADIGGLTSTDFAADPTRDTVPLAKVRGVGASPDVPALVFVGTSGRGVFNGESFSGAARAP